MKKICIIVLLTLSACTQYPVQPTLPRSTRLETKIPILINENADPPYNIREEIAFDLNRFPQSHKHINKIVIVKSFRERAVGRYKYGNIYLKSLSRQVMIETLHHEISHAMEYNMSDDDLKEWCVVMAERLDAIGMAESAKDKWRELKSYKGFPSRYSTKNVLEFIAEHVVAHTKDPESHKIYFPKEYALIIKHDLAPK